MIGWILRVITYPNAEDKDHEDDKIKCFTGFGPVGDSACRGNLSPNN
jgi:hypothetical protein